MATGTALLPAAGGSGTEENGSAEASQPACPFSALLSDAGGILPLMLNLFTYGNQTVGFTGTAAFWVSSGPDFGGRTAEITNKLLPDWNSSAK